MNCLIFSNIYHNFVPLIQDFMRRYILLLFLINFLSLPALAQLEVKQGSFKEVPGFININTEKMFDDNDKPYAVIKIKTENINDKQRHELVFQGNAATFFEIEYKVGEVWVYLSYYATYIKISHPDLSSTEFHFPFDMKPKCGYELTLVNMSNTKRDITKYYNYAIRVADNYEELYIDNQYIGLYPLDEKLAYDYNLSRNYEDSINSFKKFAFEGDPVAQNNLGACYYKGKGVEQNYDNAARWFKVSAEQGNAIGQINLAMCYIDGTGVVKDSLESLKWCQASINQGIAGADCLYGSRFCMDDKERLFWWKKSADKNCAIGQNNVGFYYDYMKKDYVEAEKWYKKAIEQGFILSKYYLGILYFYEVGFTDKKSEAFKMIKDAAENNLVLAEYAMGYSFFNGDMVVKDYDEAFNWFLKAAEKDNSRAQFFLGMCYEEGLGCIKDGKEAFKWYYKSALQNIPEAQGKVGYYYYVGDDVRQNCTESIKWYKKAAVNNENTSQYMLGYCYYFGECGLSVDYQEAYTWLEKF